MYIPKTDVILLPSHLTPHHCRDRAVVVLDVLRATTSMAAALHAGVNEIRVFPTIEEAAQAAHEHDGPRILCGEVKCLPPSGFDLGNSPGAFTPHLHAGQTLFMSTTNGTRAIRAAMQLRAETQRVAEPTNPETSPPNIYIGALVNASAVAKALMQQASDITLLCAGTNEQIAMEDLIGAGAIIHAMQRLGQQKKGVRFTFHDGGSGIKSKPDPLFDLTDTARIALRLFHQARPDLPAALKDAQGGRNILAVNLPEDITYAAQLDTLDIIGVVKDQPLTVRRL